MNLTAASPTAATPGLTNVSVTGSPFPSGAIAASDITVTLAPVTVNAGPTATFPASAIATIIGSTRRVTFAVPASLAVTAPTPYRVSLAASVNPFTTATPITITVNPPASLLSIAPNTAGQGQSVNVTITGQYSHFLQGSSIVTTGPGISVSAVAVSSPTTLTAQFTIDPLAALGSSSVSVTSGSETASLAGGFSIVQGNAAISLVSPNSAQEGQSITATVTGTGTHFAQGTTSVAFGAGITVSNVQVLSPTSLTASLAISSTATVGLRSVTATTSNEIASLSNGFSVTAGTPVFSLTPATGAQGQTLASIVISGQFTHFLQGTTTASFGAGIAVNSVTVSSATSATVSVTIDPNASVGTRTVVLTTGSETASLPNGFTVSNGTSSLTSITPNTGLQGQTLNVAVAGNSTNFVQGTTTASFGAGITVNSVTVSGPGAATVNITIDPLTALGARTVTLTTGSNVVTSVGGFTVNAGPAFISSITPATGKQGQTLTSVSVIGSATHFAQGTTAVSLGAGITVQNIQVVSAQQLLVDLIIDPAAVPGPRTVSVTTGAESAVLANGFSLSPGTPVLTSVNPAGGAQGQTVANIVISGQFTHFVQGTTTANFGAGITVNSVAVSSATSATVSVTIDPNAAPGSRAVTLTTGSEAASLAAAFTVSSGTGSLTSITPNTGAQGQTLSISVAGNSTNFVQGTTTASFGAGITVNSVTVNGPGSATVSITIDPLATLGARTVTFTTGSNVVTSVGGFSVTSGPASISSITPASGKQGQTLTSVSVVGSATHFAQGTTTVSLGAGITVQNIQVVSALQLLVDLIIDPAAVPGTRTVSTTTGAESAVLSNGFSLNPGTPILTSVNPASGAQGQTVASIAIFGQFTHFVQGTTTANFGAGITVNSLSISSAISATASVTIDPNATPGSRAVTLTTGSEAASLAAAFTVSSGTGSLTSIAPNTGAQGQTLSITVAGNSTNFVQGTTTASFGVGITVNSVSVSGPGAATVSITIDPLATLGARTVTFTTGSNVVTSANGFSVTSGPAVITVVNPSSGQQGQALTSVAITGSATHFSQGVTTVSFGPGLVTGNIHVISATALTVDLVVDPAATVGTRTISVSTGAESAALSGGFSVTAGTPVISSVTPATGTQGQALATVAISGQFTHFVQGTTTASFGAGITVNTLTINSPTSATASITIDPLANTGTRNVVLTTTGEIVSSANGFTVQAGPAVITSVVPNSAVQGQSITVTVTGSGTHFAQGSTSANFGGGITVGSVSVSSPTSATVQLTVSAGAATGARAATLITGGETATLANGFTVVGGTPAITSVNPSGGAQGQTNLSVAIVGQFTHFVQGTTTVGFTSGITVNSVTVTDATHVTANISILGTAATGAQTLTVATGAEAVTSSFTISSSSAVLLSLNPSSGQQGQTVANIAIVGQGTNFSQASTVFSLGLGITVNSLTVTDATHAIASILISSGAAPGARTATMVTGGEVASLNNAFNVTAASPVISQVTPSSAAQQATSAIVITGQFTHFSASSTVSFGAGIVVNSVTFNSATSLSANVTVSPTATTGFRDIVVITGPETVVASNGFTVTAGPAVLTSVTPASGAQGASSLSIALVGSNSNFSQATSVASFGSGVTVNSLTVTDATHATAVVAILAAASPGARTPVVTTGGESAQLTNGFTVNAATPVITSVTPNTGQQGATIASVTLLGSFTHFVQGTTTATFGTGITVNSVTVNSATSATVSLTISPTANTTYHDVTVTTGSETETLVNGFLISAGSAVLTSLTPASGNQGQQNLSVAIVGQNTNFAQGVTTFSGGNNVTAVSTVTVTDATHATVVISIDPTAVPGQRTFTLTTGGQNASLVNGFTVVAATPIISLVNPATGTLAQTIASVAITGQFTHFVQGTTTASFGNGITVNSLTVTDATHATASITIDPIAALGYRNVTLFTGTETAVGNSLFQVLQGSAVISSVVPNTGSQGQQSLTVTITGTNTHFTAGQTALSFSGGNSGITVNTLTLNSATSATALITIDPAATVGTRTVTVVTGGEVASLANGFTVNAATPIITTVNQNNGQLGQTIATIAITGQFTNFTNSSTVSFGNGITVNSVSAADLTHLSVGITISGTATLGYRNVTVTTGTEVATGSNLFQVLQGGAVISSLTPAGGRQGQTGLSVTIAGQNTNFAQGTTVADFGASITVTSLTVNSTTSATAILSITANASTGPRTVTLSTGGEIASITNGFSVTIGQPVISSVTPATAHQGDTNVSVAVTANFTNFVNGTTTASFGPGVIVNSLTVTDSTHATANLTFSPSAAPGNRDVTLTTGTEVATLVNGFVVTAGLPSISSVNPAQSSQGVSLTVQITGAFTHFTQGQTTVAFGNGITPGTVTVNGPTTLSVPVTVAANTAAGPRSVTVTTGTETVTLNAAFLVQPGTPMITVISPNTGLPNSNVTVTITGQFTNFASGTTTANFGAGIAVGGGAQGAAGPVTVNSSTTATASLAIDPAAAIGARNVTVTTGAEVESVINGFTVQANTTTPPTVISISPASSATGAPLNTAVTVQFSEPMDRTLFNSTHIYLYDTVASVNVPTTVTVDASGRIATLVPSQLLAVNRQFYTYLTGLKDTSGNALSTQLFYFTTGFSTATTGPSFVSSNISNGDTNVPLNAPITLQFSSAINPVSLTAGFQVTSSGNPVNGTSVLDATATLLTFTPAAAFTASTVYTVTYNSQLTDPAGNGLTNPGSLSFTTGTAIDTSGPTIISANPVASETGVGTNVVVRVRFDKKVTPSSITNVNFYIDNANNSSITYPGTITVSADRLSATFTPLSPLPALTQFYFQLYSYTGQNGVTGNGLTRYFTTGASTDTTAPTVITVSPANNTTGVPVNAHVSFQFSKPIDATSVLNSSVVLTPAAPGVFTFSADQLSASFVPTSALAVSTPYTVNLTGLRDIDQNLLAPFTSAFTTGASSTPDTTHGTVTSINPAGGATNVPVNSVITITINKPIDPTSLRTNTGNDSVAVFATPSGGSQAQVGGTLTVTNTSNSAVVVFTPTSPLPLSASVSVYSTYNTYITDLAGNTVNPTNATFTTVAGVDNTLPVVTSVTPANGASAVGQNTPVILTFSKPLNASTVNTNFFSLFSGTTRLGTSVTRSADGQTVTLTAALPASSNIGVVATSGVTDLVGNHLADFASSFTSAAIPPANHPNVTTVRPGNGATGVSASSPITLIIDSPLNPTTVPGALHVSQNGVLVSGTSQVSPNGQSILFTPGASFQPGALVQVFFDTTAKSTSGFSLTNFSSQFTVSPNTATSAPIVSALSPANNSTINYLNPVIDIQFSKAIDPATVNSTNVYIKQSDSVALSGSLSLISPNVIRFVPNPRTLTAGPYYRINLTNGIKDTQGNAFAGLIGQYYFYIAGTATLIDNSAPTVTSLAPSDGSTNIGDNTSFRATFSKPIDPLTVTANTFLVSGGALTVMPSSISFDSTNQNVTIVPQSPLPDNTQMTISINGITDVAGNAVTPVTAHFTTGNGADTVSPTVLLSSVTSGATNVPVNSVFTLKFSKPMDISTLTGTNFYLYSYNSGTYIPVSYSYSADRTIATLTPTTVLPVGEQFQLGARSALDLSGNLLVNFNISFFTSFAANSVAPVISDTSPASGATGVPINATVQILFSEPVQATSFGQVNLLQGGSPVAVTRSLSNGDRTLTLTPGALLNAGTAYVISVTGLLDTAGNAFSGTVTRSFTTSPGADLIAPSITSSSVGSGQTNVATNAVFRVAFSEPIDQLTVNTSNFQVYSYAVSRYLAGTVTVSADRMTALLVPVAPLQTNSQFYVYINSYTDLAGNIGNSLLNTFYTGNSANSTGPTVTSISPTSGITGVPVNTKVVARLSAPLDATTVGTGTIQLTPAAPGTIALAADRVTLTFTPTAALSPSTLYSVQIAGLLDVNGNPQTTFNSTFTTSASTVPDITGPSVTTTSPVGSTSSVPLNTTITINLNKPIDPSSITTGTGSDSLAVFASVPAGQFLIGGTVAVTNTANSSSLVFTPSNPLPASSTITVNVVYNTYIRDFAGNNIHGFSFTFTTTSGTDTTAPTVTSVTPAANSTVVGLAATVTLTFSKELNPNTISASTFALFSGSTPISTSVSHSSDNRTVFLSNGNLPASSLITVIATQAVTDLIGNHLADFSSQFTTGPASNGTAPTVISQRPANGATGVNANSTVYLISSKPLNAVTVPGAVHVSQNGVLVSGSTSLSVSGTSIVFTPSSPFTAGAVVRVFLDSTATDTTGNPATAYSGQFTVAPDLTSVAPTLVSLSPTNGSQNTPLNTVVDIQFSKPIDATTVTTANFYLRQNDATVVPATVALLFPNVVRITPNAAVTGAASPYYRINITSAVKDTTGLAYAGSLNQYYFYTSPTSVTDTVRPTVTGVAPSNNSTNIGDNALIQLTFSKPVDPLTVNATTIAVTGGSQTVTPASISFDSTNQNVVITPLAPLTINTQFTIAISGVTDPQGNIVVPLTTHFTTGPGSDLIAPFVTHSSPDSSNSASIPTNTVFTVTFSEPVDSRGLIDSNFNVYDYALGHNLPVTRSISADGLSATLTPVSLLTPGDQFLFRVNTVTDLSGNPITYYQVSGTISSTTDTVAPSVTAVNPGNATTAVPINTLLQIYFNKSIQATSLSQITLAAGATNIPVTASISNGDQVVTLTAGAPLSPNTTYTITIAGVLSTAGTPLASTVTTTFTTGSGALLSGFNVLSSTPANGTIGVAASVTPQILYNRAVNPVNAYSSVQLLTSTSAVVPSTLSFSADFTTVIITPNAALTSGSTYIIRVGYSATATDQAGNNSQNSLNNSFTVQ